MNEERTEGLERLASNCGQWRLVRMSGNHEGWHLHVAHNTWIVWAQGDYPPTVERKSWIFRPMPGVEIDFHFSLEKKREQWADFGEPFVIEERTCWAWRFMHYDTGPDSGQWEFADTYDRCLADATEYVMNTPSIRASERPEFLEAIANVVVLDQ